MGDISIAIFLDREADISIDVIVPVGATVADVKAQLAAADPSGSTKADEIVLKLPATLGGSASPLPDSTQISEKHAELDVVTEDSELADPADAAESGPGEPEDAGTAPGASAETEEVAADSAPGVAAEAAPDASADAGAEAPSNELTASPVPEEWRVVHDRVVRRADARKDAKMLGVEKKGAVIQGTSEKVDGVEWVRSKMKDGETDSFLMIDGSSVGLGKLLEKVQVVVDGDYWVMQGQLFKKPGTCPETPKVVKLTRPVGSIVKTTGKTWTGPSGGEWVELDATSEKPGWLLVEGPGFNVAGPMLEQATPGQMEPLVLKLFSMITSSELCDICVHTSQTIAKVKQWVGLRDPHGLKPSKVLVANEMPGEEERSSFSIASFPRDKLYSDNIKLQDTVFKTGDLVPYFYLGEATDDGRFAKGA